MTKFEIKFHYQAYDKLCAEVQACPKCFRMQNSARVLSRAAGPLNAPVMFVGEAPGRLGADRSEIPFHGDKAGHNFEDLLDSAGLSRADIFVTNAALCNPKDARGNNAPPSFAEIQNCSSFLKQQIDLIRPCVVVTLGASALKATSLVEHHQLVLRSNVRRAIAWYGRILIPLYHPGQRAMVHRSYANQQSDYRFVAEQLHRLHRSTKGVQGKTKADVVAIAQAIIGEAPGLSMFALHKLLYLTELTHARQYGQQLTKAFFIRQKDGPYCVDLHPKKLQKAIPQLQIDGRSRLSIGPESAKDLFGYSSGLPTPLSQEVKDEIRQIVYKYGTLTEAQLKTKVYLTVPMRRILREEKRGRVGMYNMPINLLAEDTARP